MFIYSLIMYLLTPWLLARLWWKGLQDKDYRERISERFCINPSIKEPIDIWIHAVSLGEVNAALPLIRKLAANNRRLLITTTTPTGARQLKNQKNLTIEHRYLPYDLPDAMQRFMQAYQPKVGVILETEIWPNLIMQAKNAQIPLLIVNACLSLESYQGYLNAKWFFRPLIQYFALILCQDVIDEQRFLALGASTQRVKIIGNIKFDLEITEPKLDEIIFLPELWGKHRPVVLLASTHANEEEQILKYLPKLKENIPEVLLLIAPRHPDRFQKVLQLAEKTGYQVGVRSNPETINGNSEIVVINSLGELTKFYALTDYVFLGGSLVPIGGHNILEPIAAGTPVFLGNYIDNIKPVCEVFMEEKLIISALNAEIVIAEICKLHQSPELRQEKIKKAKQILLKNRGVSKKYIEFIESFLS